MRSIIVGTAGHIDHGKSALVRALTGQDPDRLPEEKRRGITIDLGFAHLDLGEVRLGFVDVPGHERFIKNMLAGAHGIDVLALVIAADEGVMPQTREHFDICRLLGVRSGITVITKSDLVEDEMLPLVKEEAKELVAGSFLENAAVFVVSSRSGAGLDELKSGVKDLALSFPPRSSDFITRLPIDRAFSMKGFGSVVTGTLVSGEISEGDELELLPPGLAVRVRGVQVHGDSVSKAVAGQRTAVNIVGAEVSSIERGMVLAPFGSLRATQIIDVSVDVLPGAARGIRSRARVRVHIGAAEVLGRIRVLEEGGEILPGKNGLAQLRLEAPIVALHEDRFIIRAYSPAATIAGGVVVDPFALKHRGRELASSRERLRALMSSDRAVKFAALVQSSGDRGLKSSDLVARTGWNGTVLSGVAREAQQRDLVVESEGTFLAKERFDRLCSAVLRELVTHHRKEPLARGLMRETLREKIFPHSESEVFRGVMARLETQGKVVSERDTVRTSEHSVGLSPADTQLRDRLQEVYESSGLEAPGVDEAMERAGVAAGQRVYGRKILQLLIDNHTIVRLHGEMFMPVKAIEELKTKLQNYGLQHEPDWLIDVAGFKDLAGVSRKFAIPLLEYFDREHVTRRAGDKRIIVKTR